MESSNDKSELEDREESLLLLLMKKTKSKKMRQKYFWVRDIYFLIASQSSTSSFRV